MRQVNQPLLVPDLAKCAGCYLGYHLLYVRTAKSAESVLRLGSVVGVPRIRRYPERTHHDQGVQVLLVKSVHVCERTQTAPVVQVAGSWIRLITQPRGLAILHLKKRCG